MATAIFAPEVLRIEVMDLDTGEVAVVAQLDREPSSEWVDNLRDIVDSTSGMKDMAVSLDGHWLFFSLSALVQRLARPPTTGQRGWSPHKEDDPNPSAEEAQSFQSRRRGNQRR